MFRMSGRGLPRAPLEGLILICLCLGCTVWGQCWMCFYIKRRFNKECRAIVAALFF